MTRFVSSKPCSWVQPRQPLHASERYMRHGPIQGMEEPSLLQRLLGRFR